MRVTGRHGLPFYAQRYRQRVGLLVGAIIGIVLIAVLSRVYGILFYRLQRV